MGPIVVSWIGLFVFVGFVIAVFIGKFRIPNPDIQSLLKLRLHALFYSLAVVIGILFFFFTLLTAWEINALGDIIENDFSVTKERALDAQKQRAIANSLWEMYAFTAVPLMASFVVVGRVIDLRSRSVISSAVSPEPSCGKPDESEVPEPNSAVDE